MAKGFVAKYWAHCQSPGYGCEQAEDLLKAWAELAFQAKRPVHPMSRFIVFEVASQREAKRQRMDTAVCVGSSSGSSLGSSRDAVLLHRATKWTTRWRKVLSQSIGPAARAQVEDPPKPHREPHRGCLCL